MITDFSAGPTPAPSPHAPASHPTRFDRAELHRAWLVTRAAAATLEQVAAAEGWPVPFPPVRYLVLACLEEASSFGLSPRRLARLLAVGPSTLAHHLDALERAGMISRQPRGIRDGRRVQVRLTDTGRYAARRLTSP